MAKLLFLVSVYLLSVIHWWFAFTAISHRETYFPLLLPEVVQLTFEQTWKNSKLFAEFSVTFLLLIQIKFKVKFGPDYAYFEFD